MANGGLVHGMPGHLPPGGETIDTTMVTSSKVAIADSRRIVCWWRCQIRMTAPAKLDEQHSVE